jgi:hypothetical protein
MARSADTRTHTNTPGALHVAPGMPGHDLIYRRIFGLKITTTTAATATCASIIMSLQETLFDVTEMDGDKIQQQ